MANTIESTAGTRRADADTPKTTIDDCCGRAYPQYETIGVVQETRSNCHHDKTKNSSYHYRPRKRTGGIFSNYLGFAIFSILEGKGMQLSIFSDFGIRISGFGIRPLPCPLKNSRWTKHYHL